MKIAISIYRIQLSGPIYSLCKSQRQEKGEGTDMLFKETVTGNSQICKKIKVNKHPGLRKPHNTK
jgi:hypothetical protein